MTADTPDPGADHGKQTRTHKAADPHWYSLLFGPPFKIIGFFYRSFQSNRKRLARLKATSGAASLIKTALVLTLFLWIAVWLLASDESRNRLTETIQQQFRDLKGFSK